jgi:hypothetical protein
VNLEAIEHDLNSQRRDPITNAADTADASSQFVSYNRSASISNLVMSPSHLSEYILLFCSHFCHCLLINRTESVSVVFTETRKV